MKKFRTSNDLNAENTRRYFEVCFQNGIRSIPQSPTKLALTVAYWICAFALLLGASAPTANLLDRLFQPLLCVCIPTLAVLIFVVGVTVSGIPHGAFRIAHAFQRANIVNSAGEPPLPTGRFQQNGKTVVGVFTQGVSATQIQDRLQAVESALGARITKIEQGKSNQYLLLHLAPGDAKLPDKIPLPDTRPDDSSVIRLGESLDGTVTVDLNRVPHILEGGATGSGKSQLLISIISQLLLKTNARGEPTVDVYLIDLKGGMDYPKSFQKLGCSITTDPGDVLSVLSQIVGALEDRKRQFAEYSDRSGVSISSIDDFNRIFPGSSLRRIVLVVDEIAELTDTAGMDKAHKEQAAKIVAKLSTIARQGRAFGLNLVVSTQRPDATAVPGQIKNNLDCRICGKADNVLSQIILDNTSASDLIPKDSQGLFVNQDGVVFRGYLADQSMTKPDGTREKCSKEAG